MPSSASQLAAARLPSELHEGRVCLVRPEEDLPGNGGMGDMGTSSIMVPYNTVPLHICLAILGEPEKHASLLLGMRRESGAGRGLVGTEALDKICPKSSTPK